jgi:hypothetical protein
MQWGPRLQACCRGLADSRVDSLLCGVALDTSASLGDAWSSGLGGPAGHPT